MNIIRAIIKIYIRKTHHFYNMKNNRRNQPMQNNISPKTPAPTLHSQGNNYYPENAQLARKAPEKHHFTQTNPAHYFSYYKNT